MKEIKLIGNKSTQTIELDTPTRDFVDNAHKSDILDVKLNNEVRRAKSEEEKLADDISSIEQAFPIIDEAIDSLSASLSEETEERKAKDAELEAAIKESGKIDDVLVDDISVVSDKVARIDLRPIRDSIEAEAARAKGVEAAIQSDVEAEESARKSADDALQSGIDAEVSRAKEAEEALSTSLGQEASDRQAADGELRKSIDAEAERAGSAEQSIAEQVNEIVNEYGEHFGRLDSSVSSLNASMDTLAKKEKEDVQTISSEIASINGKIPAQASPDNQLADKYYVNSSIATATATFRGTVDSLSALKALKGDSNDYAFVEVKDGTTGLVLRYDRYKYSDAVSEETGNWAFEYTLNNSSFTSEQWKAINSNITSELVSKITSNEKAIAQEVLDRGDAIHNVELNVDAEKYRAQREEQDIRSNLDDEISRATAKENLLTESIAEKVAEAKEYTDTEVAPCKTYTTFTADGEDGNGYIRATIPGITELYDGLTIRLHMHTTLYRYGQLNINNLGWNAVYYRFNDNSSDYFSTIFGQGAIVIITYTKCRTNGTMGWLNLSTYIPDYNGLDARIKKVENSYVTLDTAQTITGKKTTSQRLCYLATSTLPNGYQEAEVLLKENAKIDTGIQVSSLSIPAIEMSVRFLNFLDTDYFGTATNTTSGTIIGNINTQNGVNYVHWGTMSPCGTDISWNTIDKFSYNIIKIESEAVNKHLFYCNNILLGTKTYTAVFNNTGNIFIGQGRFNNANSSWKFFKIWNEGTLIFDGIGAYEVSSGSYGFYDLVSNSFKTSSEALGTNIGESDYALVNEIPHSISQLANDSGYTTNKGTVTSVEVRMNGETKGTITDSGAIDLGTVATTDTTYTLGTSGNNVVLTPSSGDSQSITVPYAASAGSATKATQDSAGNQISTTYAKSADLSAMGDKVDSLAAKVDSLEIDGGEITQ